MPLSLSDKIEQFEIEAERYRLAVITSNHQINRERFIARALRLQNIADRIRLRNEKAENR